MGRNSSERREGLETKPSGRRPRGQRGKAAAVADKGLSEARNNPLRRVRRGSGDGTSARRTTQHGRPTPAAAAAKLGSREGLTEAGMGVGSARSTDEAG